MLTYAGKIYFFSCHSLIGSLQRYDNYRTDKILRHWGKQYEEIMSWLMEEIVFPSQLESLQDSDDLHIQELGEEIGNEIFLLFDNMHVSKSLPDEYVEYCLWVEKILKKFEDLMERNSLDGTLYQMHFKTDKSIFEQLLKAVELSRLGEQSSLALATHENIEKSATSLADLWYSEVMKQVNLL